MTTVSVNVPGFVMGNLPPSPRVQETEPGEKFGDILKNQTTEKADLNTPVEKSDQTQKKEEVSDTSEVTEGMEESNSIQSDHKEDVGKVTDEESEEVVSRESFEEMIVMMQEIVTSVKEVLMRELNLSESELEQMMSDLGVEDMDLLLADNVKQIVFEATGIDNAMALLTDESAYDTTKDVMQEFEQILTASLEETGINQEELEGYLEQMMGEVAEEAKVEPASEKPMIMVEDVRIDEEVTEIKIRANDTNQHKGEQNMADNKSPNTFVQQFFNNQTVTNATNLNALESFSMVSGAEDVMNQIMDYMEVHLSNESTTLDMQLQPENLGTLQVKISAKEGVMTAQFVTTSDTVKNILETQMIQLQDNFDKQGIKVEAIEVTVETHQFEQNLNGNGERQNAQEGQKPRTRRIDLSKLDETQEVTQEERLVAEMMAANGNTVDYLA